MPLPLWLSLVSFSFAFHLAVQRVQRIFHHLAIAAIYCLSIWSPFCATFLTSSDEPLKIWLLFLLTLNKNAFSQ